MRSLGITSAMPQEGKTLTAINLAISLSETYGQRVLLVDADLRRPGVARQLDLELPDDDLTSWLERGATATWPVVQASSRLSVVPARPAVSDPVALLTAPGFARCVRDAQERWDWVLVDTPPAAVLCDADVVADYVDGFLMVVAAGSTSQATVQGALSALGSQRVLGIVLNRAIETTGTRDGAYRDYYRGTAGVRHSD